VKILQVLLVVLELLLQVLDVLGLGLAAEAVDGGLEVAEVRRVEVFLVLGGRGLLTLQRLLNEGKALLNNRSHQLIFSFF
jgi:hypothetical protein